MKVIYIDPPYNTGKDFVYKDNYKDNLLNYQKLTGQKDGQGNKIFTNKETDGRYHSNWLSMMYPRLMLARNLLREDGVIFVSIDDRELKNILHVMMDIFGERQHLGTIIHQRAKGGGQAKHIVKGHDYILVFVKQYQSSTVLKRKKTVNKKNITKIDGIEYLVNDDYIRKVFGKYDRSLNDRRCFYEEIEKYKGTQKKQEIDALIAEGKLILQRNKFGLHTICELIPVDKAFAKLYSIIKVLSEEGKKDLENLGIIGFDYPKPKDLLKNLVNTITLGSNEKVIILDFFAGSCTTAHAVLDLNKEDLGDRRFIMIQIPEKTTESGEAFNAGYHTISELGKDRIRRVVKKIKKEHPEKSNSMDLGFKVFKLDSSNIKSWDGNPDRLKDSLFDAVENIKSDRSEEDVLYEILIKYGLDISLPIEVREIEDEKVFNVGNGSLFVCLGENINRDIANEIGVWKKECESDFSRVIFKDSGFTDMEKTNSILTLKKFGITEIKSV